MLVPGAPKSGSTSLWTYLRRHPMIFMAPKKELWFFSEDSGWLKGLDWYARQFPGYNGEKIVGEATPTYLYSAKALSRIKETIPDVRLVFILRNPVRRAFSHYWHNMAKLVEKRRFEEAMKQDMESIPQKDPGKGSCSYFWMGCYERYLRPWYDSFPKRNLLVILFEELRDQPSDVLSRIYRFLDVAEINPSRESRRENPGKYFRYPWMRYFYTSFPKKELVLRALPDKYRNQFRSLRDKACFENERPTMSHCMESRLAEAYDEEITRLEKRLERDLSIWRIGRGDAGGI